MTASFLMQKFYRYVAILLGRIAAVYHRCLTNSQERTENLTMRSVRQRAYAT